MANLPAKNGEVCRGGTSFTVRSIASSSFSDAVPAEGCTRLSEENESNMPEPIGKLTEMKPGVWINPDAVAMATCVPDGAWMMPLGMGRSLS